ncbi:MAG: hypothetical protein Q4C47_02070, partial [Planctomycetia bacterium]|nr:hypothetical protein [Planctomycetia bacterium]
MERQFLGWSEPGGGTAAEWIFRRYTTDAASEIDLHEVIIAVTGQRAGRLLRDRFVILAERAEKPLRLPIITTIGTLPERLYRQRRPMASKLTLQLAWKTAIERISATEHGPEILMSVSGRPYQELDTESQFALADLLMRLHTELASQCLDFATLAEKMDQLVVSGGWRKLFSHQRDCLAEKNRWKALAEIQNHCLYGILDRIVAGDGKETVWDLQSARLFALNEKPEEIGTSCEIFLVGTVDMPRVIRNLIGHEKIRDRVTPLIFAPSSEADGFDELGCLNTAYWLNRDVPLADDSIELVDSPRDQAEAVVRFLASLPEGTTRRDVSIGVPDPGLIPVLRRVCGDVGVPVMSPAGRTVAETSIYRLLAAISDYIEHRTFTDFATLVRHPEVYARISERTRTPESPGVVDVSGSENAGGPGNALRESENLPESENVSGSENV